MDNPVNLFKRLLRLEESARLFEYCSEGYALWDILRYHVFQTLIAKSGSEPTPEPIAPVTRRLGVSGVLRKVSAAVKFHATIRRAPVFVFSCARNRNGQGDLVDVAGKQLTDLLGGDYLEAETGVGERSEWFFAHRTILTTLFSLRRRRALPADLDPVLQAVGSEFGLDQETLRGLCAGIIRRFRAECAYYRYVLKRTGAKLVLITQNDIQKALIFTAKHCGARTVEFQHGIIFRAHPSYSYSRDCHYPCTNTVPDMLCLFSSYWKNLCFMPGAETVVLGNDFFFDPQSLHAYARSGQAKEANEIGDPDSFARRNNLKEPFLLVISSMVHQRELERFLAEWQPDFPVIMKLHPGQWNDSSVDDRALERGGIRVLRGEIPISELIRASKGVLLIQSTAAYEALHAGVPVYILRRLNYEGHEDLFGEPGVAVVDNPQEIESAMRSATRKPAERRFFEPFHEAEARAILGNLAVR